MHSTHTVELSSYEVTKRFREGSVPEAEREWRALELLAAHAPGLTPVPLGAEFDGTAPLIRMTRLPGDPLRGLAQQTAAVDALAEAVSRLHAALPPPVLATVPRRPDGPDALTRWLRSRTSRVRPLPHGPVDAAMRAGLRWLDRSRVRDVPGDVREVFGGGDGNLANYLWDGARGRIVDFEDSGRSDRAFELAEITEHVGSWVRGPLDVPAFLARFDLTPAESARLRECRRLLALVWLVLLWADEAGEHPRNPPGTAGRQAARLAELLG
ncbi:phosphotransferase family protein [Streptomyces nanshensis]|uniref:phosphotransferase family protein n=1 Tax=Streptomyces nanshensis TaxID=518642 RepID=UPI000ADD0AE5|nr:aminoglycoside phosphotransferase family protein [Streptomyces nanshensis]